jgi:hypothetical protein
MVMVDPGQGEEAQGEWLDGDSPAGAAGHRKQALFEEARKMIGQARHGAMARKDNLRLESVMGEGTFGKVFKGELPGLLLRPTAYV